MVCVSVVWNQVLECVIGALANAPAAIDVAIFLGVCNGVVPLRGTSDDVIGEDFWCDAVRATREASVRIELRLDRIGCKEKWI